MSEKKSKIIGLGTFLLALGFIGYGACRGEVSTVFSKAIRICLECVGIG